MVRRAIAVVAAMIMAGVAGCEPKGGPSNPQDPRPQIVALAATPSGSWLGAAVAFVQVDRIRQVVVRSDDGGTTWSTVSTVPDSADPAPEVVVGSDSDVWYITYDTIFASTDAGRTWKPWPLTSKGTRPSSGRPGAVARGGTLWFVWDGRIFTATAGREPRPIPTQPSSTGADRLAALSPRHALSFTLFGPQGRSWHETNDGGTTWRPTTEPCDQTAQPPSLILRTASDGSIWAGCAADSKMSWTLAVSADGGHTWSRHGSPITGDDDLTPMSSTIAWRTGGKDIYRSTDSGDTWPTVRHREPPADPTTYPLFVAVTADVAAYVTWGNHGRDVFTVTTDGGKTWTDHPVQL